MIDDSQEFEEKKTRDIKKLGSNASIFQQSKNIIASLDKYNYTYLWSWLGLPIIQWPADILATQEVVWEVQPDVIIETGVARGGSVVFLAALQKLLGDGIVLGIDIDIRAHNRQAIENHILHDRIVLIEGSSTSSHVIEMIRNHIKPGAKVMVILDSDHSYEHVLRECNIYANLVSVGSYLIVADTVVGYFHKGELSGDRSKEWYKGNEPLAARDKFLLANDDFELASINDKLVLSSSPGGYLRRIR